MLKNRRKIFVICIIVLIVAAITIFVATGNFANLVKRIFTLQKLKGTPEFSYDVYSNENNKIIVSIKAVDVDGIKQIEYPNDSLTLYCNGKQTVSLDYEIQEQTDYTFKVTNENDEVKTHTVRIDNLDDYIKIDVSSEKELGTEAKINITFGTEGTTNQYVIGKNNTNWNLYENEINLDSYTIIENNWGNEDFTTTIKAKATDDAGNIIEIERIITCLDIDIANEPVITATSNGEYPVITEYGVRVQTTIEKLEYDTRDDITNYYSIDGGKTWNIYNDISDLSNIESIGTIKAKSVKNVSGLEMESSEYVNIPSDALNPRAYDNDMETFIYSYVWGGQTLGYIYIDETMKSKNIDITAVTFAQNFSYSVTFYNETTQLSRTEIAKWDITTDKIEIPENADKALFSAHGAGGTKIFEIQIANEPTFNVEKNYPLLTAESILYYNEVTINYFRTSVQRLYSFDETTWQTYNGETINLETSKKIHAKGIDEYGKETKVVSYESELLSDAIPEEVYDGNLDTGFGSWNPMYMEVDSSAIGKKIRLHIKNGWNDGTYCTGYVELLNKEKESIYHNDFYVRVEDYLEDVEILEGTKFVKIYAGRKYIYNRNRTY